MEICRPVSLSLPSGPSPAPWLLSATTTTPQSFSECCMFACMHADRIYTRTCAYPALKSVVLPLQSRSVPYSNCRPFLPRRSIPHGGHPFICIHPRAIQSFNHFQPSRQFPSRAYKYVHHVSSVGDHTRTYLPRVTRVFYLLTLTEYLPKCAKYFNVAAE